MSGNLNSEEEENRPLIVQCQVKALATKDSTAHDPMLNKQEETQVHTTKVQTTDQFQMEKENEKNSENNSPLNDTNGGVTDSAAEPKCLTSSHLVKNNDQIQEPNSSKTEYSDRSSSQTGAKESTDEVAIDIGAAEDRHIIIKKNDKNGKNSLTGSENSQLPSFNQVTEKEILSGVTELTRKNEVETKCTDYVFANDDNPLTRGDSKVRKTSDAGSVYHDCKSVASCDSSSVNFPSNVHLEDGFSDSNITKPDQTKSLQHMKSFSETSTCPTQSTLNDFCRICHCEGDVELGPLIAPCYCRGSLRYVHQACLQQWIKSSDSKNCELCCYPFVMDSKLKPFHKWKKLSMSTAERRKIMCSVMFHIIAITCVVWSLYVLIERTASEIQDGKLQWPFWTKLVVVAIGFTGGLVFMYVQCKVYVQLWRRLKAYNRVIYVKTYPPSATTTPDEPGPAVDAESVRSVPSAVGIPSHHSNNAVVMECEQSRNRV